MLHCFEPGVHVPAHAPVVLSQTNGQTVPIGCHAPVASHSIPFYTSIPSATEKAYLELNNASHFFPQTTNTPTARQTVAWLKRFVDDDTRYDQFLCPGPSSSSISDYRDTCPLS